MNIVEEQIIEKIKKFLPEACAGENTCLPYVAFPLHSTLSENLRMVEKILVCLRDAGICPAVLFDLKNEFLEIRYAITDEQRDILDLARS